VTVRRAVVCLVVLVVVSGCGDRSILEVPSSVELPSSIGRLWAVDVTNVYLSGGHSDNLWHFEGQSWAPLHLNDDMTQNPEVGYFGGTGPDDVWLSDHYHFDGAIWTEKASQGGVSVIGLGPDGALYGFRRCGQDCSIPALVRAESGEWKSVMDLPAWASSAWVDPSSGEVYAPVIGQPDGGAPTVIHHFDGQQWSSFDLGQPVHVVVWSTRDGEAYAYGAKQMSGSLAQGGVLFRRDGGGWKAIYETTERLFSMGGTKTTGPLLGGSGAVYRLDQDNLVPLLTDDTMEFVQVQVVDQYLILHGKSKKKAMGNFLLIRDLGQ